ncbi:MAG TPA: hypothetical protein VGE50_11965 [Gammaproteobacteria bacterium]
MTMPQIGTAIPKRRYQLGEFTAVVLGDVESRDGEEYRYVMALVPEGQQQPIFFVSSVRNRSGNEGSHRLRASSTQLTRDMGASDGWANLDSFCEEALQVARQAMGLMDEQPLRLS